MGLRHRRMLSADRSLPCDVVHFSGKVPIARAEMCCELGSLQRQRAMVQPRMSWASLFLRAYGIVCNRHEFLRTSYMPWPFPHLYLHPHTVAMVAMHREYRERPRLCWARIVDPAGRSLRALQAKLAPPVVEHASGISRIRHRQGTHAPAAWCGALSPGRLLRPARARHGRGRPRWRLESRRTDRPRLGLLR